MQKSINFIFLFILSSFNISVNAQGVSNLWVMGYQSIGGPPYGGVNFDFTGGSLSIIYQSRKMNFEETNAVICDRSGNFLFSSNGSWIANSSNDTLVNGSGLNPSVYTSMWLSDGLTIPQANLIIPFPSDSMKYYLFHKTVDHYGNPPVALYQYYSIIDMSQDSGRGAVVQKNIVLLNDSLINGQLTACKHANGRDWWVITHQWNTNKYYKYLVTNTNILGPYTQNIGTRRASSGDQCAFSPDGTKYAFYEALTRNLDVFDFDRCTGNFTEKSLISINDSANGGGVAFSASSEVLYVSSTSYVYQFDMNATDIAASKITVAIYDGFSSPGPPFYTSFYLAQLAPDGKIYINCGNGTDYMHVINHPDSLGLACDVCQHCVHLPAYNAFTIANHPNYFLGALKGSVCDTLSNIDVQEIAGKNQLNVFPNPVSNSEEVTFTYSSTSDAKAIEIYNIDGKIVASYNLPPWSSVQHLKLPKLSSGIYLAKLTSGNHTSNLKFVVQ